MPTDGLSDWKVTEPYIERQAVRMRTRPAALKQPEISAVPSILRSGPSLMNGPTRRKPWARPISTPLRRGETPVRYAGKLER